MGLTLKKKNLKNLPNVPKDFVFDLRCKFKETEKLEFYGIV